MYVVVGVGIGNKILQVCLDGGQNRLKKTSYVYLGGQVEQFLRQEFQGPSLNISIQTYIRSYLPDRKGRQVTTCSRIKGKTCGIPPPIYGQIEVENFSK